MSSVIAHKARYEIRFPSLSPEGHGLSFPCDAEDHVDLDDMSDAARNDYLYARALVGREFASPAVHRTDMR